MFKAMPDWMERTVKTFIQAFLGTIIPSFASYISDGWPEDLETVWVWLAPVVMSALSAAICAVWNVLNQYLNPTQTATKTDGK